MSREPYATSDGYILYPLSDVDRDNHVELQRQINGDGTLFLVPGIKDMMWDTLLSDTNTTKLYSIFENNGDYCGCIELQQYHTDTPEIGLNLIETKRNQGIAAKVVKSLVQTVCSERDIEYFLIRIMSNNPHSRYVFEKMGAVPIGEEEHPYVVLMNRLKTTLAQDTVNEIQGAIKDLMVDNDEEEFVYRYKLMPDVFE